MHRAMVKHPMTKALMRKPSRGAITKVVAACQPVSLGKFVRHELSEEDRKCPCCSELRTEFSVEKSEQLEYIPAHWKAIEHHRVKYCCTACQEKVIVAPKPPQPIEKGLPGPGLCAYSVLSKSATTCRCIAKKIFTAVPAHHSSQYDLRLAFTVGPAAEHCDADEASDP